MKTIVIDPGHGGFDPGATSRGLHEAAINLEIGLRIEKLFANYADEIHIIMTRTEDVSPLGTTEKNAQLEARAHIANDANADLFISIHVNANGGEGFESYVMEGITDDATLNIQHIIHEKLASFYAGYGVVDRGMKQADFSVLRNTHMPAVLIENLFIDDPHDAALLTNGSILDGIAQTIVSSLLSIAGVEEKKSDAAPGVPVTNDQELIDAIAFVKLHGIMHGYNDTTFGENDRLTRGQLAVILYRIHGNGGAI